MEPGTTTPINKNSTPLRRQTPRKTNSPFKRTGPLFPKTPSRTPDGSLQLCRHLCLQKNLCKHKCCKRGMFDSNGEPISADSVTELTEESDEENENALQNYISINERYNLITPIRHTKTTETSFQETKMDVEQQETPSRISNSSLPHIEANLMSPSPKNFELILHRIVLNNTSNQMQTHNPHLKEISDESQKKAIIHEVPPNKVNEGFFVDNEHQEAQPPFIINNQLPQDKNPALQLPVFSDNQSSPNYQGKEEPPIVASISSESNNIMKNTDKPQNFEPTQTTSKISEQPNFSSKSPSIIPQIRPQKPALTKINTPKGNSNSFRNQTKVFTCSNDASPKRKVEESSPTTIIKRRKVEPSPILKSPSKTNDNPHYTEESNKILFTANVMSFFCVAFACYYLSSSLHA